LKSSFFPDFKHIKNFIFGTFFLRAFGFINTIVLARLISVETLDRYIYLMSLFPIFNQVISLQFHNSIDKIYFKEDFNYDTFYTTAITLSSIVFIFLVICSFFFNILGIQIISQFEFILLIISSYLSILFSIGINFKKLNLESSLYVRGIILQKAIEFLLLIILILLGLLKLKTIFIPLMLSYLSVIFIFDRTSLKKVRFKSFSTSYIIESLPYCSTMLLLSIIGYFNVTIDRLYIGQLTIQAGILSKYYICFMYSSLFFVVSDGFWNSRAVQLTQNIKKGIVGSVRQDFATVLLMNVLVSIGLFTLAYPVIFLFFGKIYTDYLYLIPLMLLANNIISLNKYFEVYFIYLNKGKVLIMSTLVSLSLLFSTLSIFYNMFGLIGLSFSILFSTLITIFINSLYFMFFIKKSVDSLH
jgi:O-antigen/teichoic acid export membrane protein